MQTIEATISLLVLLTISLSLLQVIPEQKIDDSLYRMQLAEDTWRTLYLSDDFRDFSQLKRADIERDLVIIGDETSLCIFIEGIRVTNCRWNVGETSGPEMHERIASIERTLIEGGSAKRVMLTLTTRH